MTHLSETFQRTPMTGKTGVGGIHIHVNSGQENEIRTDKIGAATSKGTLKSRHEMSRALL